MNNREKALNGFLFKRGDPVLADMRIRAKDLCFDFNNTRPSDTKTKEAILRQLIGNIKGNFTILSPFLCDYGDFITLGDNFFANYNCQILDGGKITFGDNVLIGPNCTFTSVSHTLDPSQRLEGLQIFLPITVGNNVWFGSNVTVLGGVTIGDNSVIAAGSVVTRNIPANSFAAGVPCKVIRELNEKDKEKYPFAPED